MGASQSNAKTINSDKLQHQIDFQESSSSNSIGNTSSPPSLAIDRRNSGDIGGIRHDQVAVSVWDKQQYDPMPLMGKRSESFEEKLYRKVTTEPLVPIGCCVTTYFLSSGIRSFLNRDSARSQLMMRGRVAAQACTVLAFCFYAGFSNLSLGFQPSKNKSAPEDK
jgi:hypothetical protein